MSLPLSAGAGTYPLHGIVPGRREHLARPQPPSLFTITAAGSTVTVTCPATVIYTGAAQTPCTARATAPDGLNELAAGELHGQHGTGNGHRQRASSTAMPRTPRARRSTTFGIIWPFTGFSCPVDNPPTVNMANAGGRIPIRFSLGGNRGLAIIAGGAPTVVGVSCPSGAPTGTVDQAGTFTVGLSYVKLTGRYLYGWKVPTTYANRCYRLELRLVDGSIHTAMFKFK